MTQDISLALETENATERTIEVVSLILKNGKGDKRKMTDKEIEVIVKPIFTKMFNSNFSACEYGIECFKKGMEYQGIKELATENDNLIEQIRVLKEQIEKMQETLKSDLIARLKENISYSTSPSCTKGMELFIKSIEKWEIKEK